MIVEVKKENFCSLIDAIEETWRFYERLSELLEIELYESKITELVDSINNFIVKLFYKDLNDINKIDDINYYMWELDFGRKWKTGMVTIDGIDIPLRSSEDLWNILNEK